MLGCTKISPGYKFCYAERFAERFRGVPEFPFEQGFDLRLVPEKLADPLRWRAPKMIFVNSMSDLFHEQVPDHYIESLAQVTVKANWHTNHVLTKRSQRRRDYLDRNSSLQKVSEESGGALDVVDIQLLCASNTRLAAVRSASEIFFYRTSPEDLGPSKNAGIDGSIVGGVERLRADSECKLGAALRRQCR